MFQRASFDENFFENKEEIGKLRLQLLKSLAFYYFLSLFIDFFRLNGISIPYKSPPDFSTCVDPESCREQLKICKEKVENLPLKINHLDKIFGNIEEEGVQNLCLSWRNGENLAITGPNGSGKSTTLKAIMKFFGVVKGNVTTFGDKSGIYKLMENGFFLSEEPNFWEELEIEEHFRLVGILKGMGKDDSKFWMESFELVPVNNM